MEVAVLRLVHLACGIVWAGGAVLMGFFVIPALGEAGPAAGPVMRGIGQRRLPQLMSGLGLLTLISGLRLYQLRFSMAWLTMPEGVVLTLGALLGIGGFVIGVGVQRPLAGRMAALGAKVGPSGPTPDQAQEMAALQARMARVAKLVGAHLGVAALLMSALRLAQALT